MIYIYIYIFMILLAAFPLVLTAWRMRRAAHIRKNGIHVDGNITHIRTIRIKHTQIDQLTIEYKDRATGHLHSAKATAAPGKYRYSDRMTIAYLPNDPSKNTVPEAQRGYLGVLIFCIILFAFVCFAVYKIDEMVRTGAM